MQLEAEICFENNLNGTPQVEQIALLFNKELIASFEPASKPLPISFHHRTTEGIFGKIEQHFFKLCPPRFSNRFHDYQYSTCLKLAFGLDWGLYQLLPHSFLLLLNDLWRNQQVRIMDYSPFAAQILDLRDLTYQDLP